MVKELELHLLVFLILQYLNLNFGTRKLVCSKLGYQCQQQLVSTPDFLISLSNTKLYLTSKTEHYQDKTEENKLFL